MGILGIGAGKMGLQLNSTNFLAGDTITGKAILTLNEPVKARGVMVSFWGEYRFKRNDIEILFSVEKRLDNGGEYSKTAEPQSYEFSLQIPENVTSRANTGNEMIDKFVSSVQQLDEDKLRYFVQAKLDMPLGFDISKKLEVSVKPKK